MGAANIGLGTESRDNRPRNQTSDGSCDMESNETDQSVQNFGVQIKEEPNMDDTCTYGTSSCDVADFIGQLSDYPSDNSLKRNLDVHSELSSVFRDGTDYAVCIKYEPTSSETERQTHVQTKDDHIEPDKARNKLCYHDHPDHGQSYHDNPDNSHHGGDGKNAFYNLQNKDTQRKHETMECKNTEHPSQRNTIPYTNNNSGSSARNHHDHNHIFSISNEKINDLDNYDKSPDRQHTTRKVFKCEICSYSITMPLCSEANYRKDTEMKQYKCDMCSYSTFYPRNLAFHNQEHTGKKLHTCDVCSYSTSRSNRLVIHQQKHTGEKPFKCEVCSFSTYWSSNLERHKRIHTGEKPYKCNVCSYSASHSGYLSAHRRIHTGEKPYKCDVCSYRTDRPYHLAKHKQKHTGEKPYMCDVCSYTTAYISNMRSHKRKHIGEKQYKCDVCSYSTNWSHNLVIHKRKHTGVKPYMFDHCYCKQSAVALTKSLSKKTY